jgi:hypothetical protein
MDFRSLVIPIRMKEVFTMVFADRIPERRIVRKQVKLSGRNLRDSRYEHNWYATRFFSKPVSHSFSRCERTILRGLVLVEVSFDSDKKGYFCKTRECIR